jgi:cyclopropane fatty-acyl-phospholipid synthase-like methyltransferase
MMMNNSAEYEKMQAAEGSHWWYKNLHRLTLEALTSDVQLTFDASILDAGCGTGGMMLALQAAGFTHVEGFDLSDNAVGFCEQHRLKVSKGDLRLMGTQYQGRLFDVVVSHDTICYLSNTEQQRYFADVALLLKPGGRLIMNAPINPAFAGTHDLAVGIRERLSPEQLISLSVGAGLSVKRCCHHKSAYELVLASQPTQRPSGRTGPIRCLQSVCCMQSVCCITQHQSTN